MGKKTKQKDKPAKWDKLQKSKFSQGPKNAESLGKMAKMNVEDYVLKNRDGQM
jgi:hypothetical protein